MDESNGERKKVIVMVFKRCCVSDVLIFNLKDGKNVDFLCTNAIEHDF